MIIVCRTRGEHHLSTQIIPTRLAEFACSAGKAGFDGDSITDLDRSHVGANGVDGAGCFVAHHDRVGRVDFVAHAALGPEMDVGTTDAGVGDAD